MQNDRSGGFLSKVFGIVRGTSGAQVGAQGAEIDAPNNREALQEVVERKRRNDAIRQQEFAQLRQLRQRSAMASQGAQAAATRAGFLPSVISGQDVRSSQTLQKIDEIEAQMSGQWRQQPAVSAAAADARSAREVPPGGSLSRLPVLGEESVVHSAQDMVAGRSSDMPVLEAEPPVQPARNVAPAKAVEVEVGKSTAPAVFKPHPDLEEAAILFAHGDVQGARTRLLEQLVQSLNAAPVDEVKVAVLWHAVLDLCRATGDEETFEPLAIDYADHFGRSAPLWFSIPERLGMPPLATGAPQKTSKRQFQWSSPLMVTVGAVTALRAAHDGAPQPWSMSWLRLNSIDEAALQPLTKLVQEWGSANGQFVMSDAGKLLQLLEQNTPTGDASYAQSWWALRMAVLRMLDRMEEYEQVALDYCITYEVSPPSWEAPGCQCLVQEEGEVDASLLEETMLHSRHGMNSQMPVPEAHPRLGQGLGGVIEGDPQPWLDALSEKAKPGQQVDVNCEDLIRLDFVAAGGVLNWAAEMQAKGHVLRFTHLHQLVAVFFHVIGIHEHATVQATMA